MPQRNTLDLNILVLSAAAPALHVELAGRGHAQAGTLTTGGTSWRTPEGEILDVLESDEAWAIGAMATPNRMSDGLPVIALPYLVLMKLAASRAQDLADVSRMLGIADSEALKSVRETVMRFRPSDSADLESLITLGLLE